MLQKALLLTKTYALTVLFFLLAKLVFMACNANEHDFTAADVFGVLGHGISLDLSTAL